MKNFKIIFAALLAIVFGTACNHELDEAPYLTFDGEANMTIADLLDLHYVGEADSYDSIPDNTIICGVITSSDEADNCYKYLTIQDETGGIMIKVDDSHLYPKYQIGQKIYVKCGDMVIGDYRKNKQIGFWVDGSMTGIASSQEDLYIFRDGLVGPEPDAIVISSASQIDESLYNRLVKLENCHFALGGQANYCDAGQNTSRDIVFADNSSIVLRTSSYATFANDLLPDGEGDLYGILTIYNRTVQFVIRTLADVKIGSSSQTTAENCFNLELQHGQDPFGTANPWLRSSNDWYFYDVENAAPAFAITGAKDSWLISPTFANLRNYQSIYFSLAEEHLGNGTFEVYYSTSHTAGSTFDASQWTLCQAGQPLPDNITSNSNFRLAFHYVGGNYWKITGLQLFGIRTR